VCCVTLFVGTFIVMDKIQWKYNMIISKSKTLLVLGFFHVDCDFIIQNSINSSKIPSLTYRDFGGFHVECLSSNLDISISACD